MNGEVVRLADLPNIIIIPIRTRCGGTFHSFLLMLSKEFRVENRGIGWKWNALLDEMETMLKNGWVVGGSKSAMTLLLTNERI